MGLPRFINGKPYYDSVHGLPAHECCCEEPPACIALCSCCYSEDAITSFTLPEIVNVEGAYWSGYTAGQQQAMEDFVAWYNANIAGTTLVTEQLGAGGEYWSGSDSYADMTSVDSDGNPADYTMSAIWRVDCKWQIYVRFSAYIGGPNDYNIEFTLDMSDGTATCCGASVIVDLTNINVSPEVDLAASPTASVVVSGNKCCADADTRACTHVGTEQCSNAEDDGECA